MTKEDMKLYENELYERALKYREVYNKQPSDFYKGVLAGLEYAIRMLDEVRYATLPDDEEEDD